MTQREMKKQIKEKDTEYFVKIWIATEGDISLLAKIFKMTHRQVVQRANYLRQKKKNLPKSKFKT